jgi:hypothetical protein
MTLQLTEELRVGLLEDAYRRGYDYLPKWGACAPTTFAAIMDTLGYADDQLARDIWKATVGLTGGTGNMAIGTCGAMAGAAAAISFSFGFTREDVEQDNNKMILINKAVAEVGKQMVKLFGHTVCQEVQLRNWGKAYHFSNPDVLGEFSKMAMNTTGRMRCSDVTGTLTRLAVEKILEYNPQFVKLQYSL